MMLVSFSAAYASARLSVVDSGRMGGLNVIVGHGRHADHPGLPGSGDANLIPIEVARLPEDVVALIDALEPGENLVLTRDGASIATISSTVDVVQGAVVDRDTPEEANDRPPIDYDGVTVVATAMKLSKAARMSLSTQLGADYIVLDMHAAPATTDVLLAPPGSPQLIASLRSMFPKARVIITEIEDHELGVNYHGPVRRLLNAGADAYLPATSVPRLARQLDYTLTHGLQLTGGIATPLEIAPATEPPDPDDG